MFGLPIDVTRPANPTGARDRRPVSPRGDARRRPSSARRRPSCVLNVEILERLQLLTAYPGMTAFGDQSFHSNGPNYTMGEFNVLYDPQSSTFYESYVSGYNTAQLGQQLGELNNPGSPTDTIIPVYASVADDNKPGGAIDAIVYDMNQRMFIGKDSDRSGNVYTVVSAPSGGSSSSIPIHANFLNDGTSNPFVDGVVFDPTTDIFYDTLGHSQHLGNPSHRTIPLMAYPGQYGFFNTYVYDATTATFMADVPDANGVDHYYGQQLGFTNDANIPISVTLNSNHQLEAIIYDETNFTFYGNVWQIGTNNYYSQQLGYGPANNNVPIGATFANGGINGIIYDKVDRIFTANSWQNGVDNYYNQQIGYAGDNNIPINAYLSGGKINGFIYDGTNHTFYQNVWQNGVNNYSSFGFSGNTTNPQDMPEVAWRTLPGLQSLVGMSASTQPASQAAGDSETGAAAAPAASVTPNKNGRALPPTSVSPPAASSESVPSSLSGGRGHGQAARGLFGDLAVIPPLRSRWVRQSLPKPG